MTGSYDDIINLPHHISTRHPQMPIRDRAAQFSPFAALTGYEGEIKEAARLTEKKIDLSEDQKADLDEHLRLLEDTLPHCPTATFTYFKPDAKKDGGAYIVVKGRLKKLDRVNRSIILTDRTAIPVDDLVSVEICY